MPDKPWLPTPWGGRELDPFFRGFRTQLDSLFEDWFGRSMGGTLAPRVDVSETGKEVTLKVELPGVEENDIDVSLSGAPHRGEADAVVRPSSGPDRCGARGAQGRRAPRWHRPALTDACLAVQALKWGTCTYRAALYGARASLADPIAATRRERLDKGRCG